jgi:hypothetical protein
MKTQMVGAGLLGAALGWAAVSAQQAQQDVRSTPGLGSGIVTVTGAVEVANSPTVEALQAGQWTVALAQPADVRLAGTSRIAFALPGIVQARGRYAIVWSGGERETITAEQLGTDGWLRTATDGRPRWINLAMARSIEELK